MTTTAYDPLEVGKRVKQIEKELGISQARLAKILGMGAPTLAKAEKGKRAIKNDELLKLSKLCGRSIEWILTGDGNEERKDKRAYTEEWKQMGIEDRRKLLNAIQAKRNEMQQAENRIRDELTGLCS
ncbi:helix-turn-helix domain-containing protein [uncultured Dialister sp.]|uniref:helix-turn-helix domain-containing protein n=1 Tax=uncultured Dialister sp. TaxID=278064 RepID=UPI00265D31F6|nr:helix-turn-helix transcriptional regulator [uncultured Dialister sp.]